jgi:hypothetical protein
LEIACVLGQQVDQVERESERCLLTVAVGRVGGEGGGLRSELLGTDLVPAQLLSPAPDDTSAFKEQFHAATSSMQSSSGSRARKRRASRKLAARMVVVRGASLRDALEQDE